MDKDILQRRIDDLQKGAAECLAQYHMVNGRLEEAKYLMQQMDMQKLVDEGEKVQ